ncbi:MAG TPA: 16S rRNA (guanine(527)-N(7))-methyltransferase RsmG, partial [Chitinophagaceae bacterium]|nr:16S rRNA (guanine(527)-N(7))-methyltransferase RsmG [Chitinophagaceae bacterium]
QHIRAEEIKNRKFDFAVSRAVAPLKELWGWARPLLRRSVGSDPAPGLICLKGGDLTQEVQESGCRPKLIELHELFERAYFKEKYLLYVPR